MGMILIRLLEGESGIGSKVIVKLSQERDEIIVILQNLMGDLSALTSSSRELFLF